VVLTLDNTSPRIVAKGKSFVKGCFLSFEPFCVHLAFKFFQSGYKEKKWLQGKKNCAKKTKVCKKTRRNLCFYLLYNFFAFISCSSKFLPYKIC
jgi:hypothetical protein